MTSQLIQGIAAHLAEWQRAHIELAIHGCEDPAAIAAAIDEFCRRELHSAATQLLFYRSSIGAAAGLILQDGRKVVVKAHQPEWSRQSLLEIARLQNHVAGSLRIAPRVLAGPAPLGRGFAIAETFEDRGMPADAHRPPVRRALAASLHKIIENLSSFTEALLPAHILASPPAAALWPTPHSKLFDFEATVEGAGYIDAVAAAARARMTPVGRMVTGHGDWRAEHVRFDGDEPVLAFDWDSLCREREPALVGATAHMFCADWSRDDYVQTPSLEEARDFVADYEAAAGHRFSKAERVLCGAAFAYSVAYTSRCGHSAGIDTRAEPGTFQHLIATAGSRLIDL